MNQVQVTSNLPGQPSNVQFHNTTHQQGQLVTGSSSIPVGVTSSAPTPVMTLGQPGLAIRQPIPSSGQSSMGVQDTKVLDKRRLQELVKEVDPMEQLDDDVEEVLMHIADDFIENVVSAACKIAKHRKSNTLEVKDVQMHLERNWNIYVPGYGSDELRPYKKAATTEAHKQRMALIKKTLKKF
ncbi:transcription initiation factor TFIID subunit 12-like [Mytilus galloprovincialis]|uniref:Transcription initiation factor TFIID subunit 12 n=1 Tax=Mytilus galloprovincialis TaxID=29158 RepID=A0A8B6G078_MYTGA|nr:transcription initiation factor TFIID subunit 12 [Mytilus galloprovincialis]